MTPSPSPSPPSVRRARLESTPPLAALALAVFWCGTFHAGGAAERAAMATTVLVLGMLGARSWRDPLAVGGVLPSALLLCVGMSLLASPVRRAGLEAVVLLPAFGLAVAGTARCWRQPAARRWAVRGVGLLVLAATTWSIADWGVRGAASAVTEPIRTALPLGHHNLLAAWLVALLPLASLLLREKRWWWRGTGALALLLGAGALVLSRSLAGHFAATVQLAIWLGLWLRSRRGGRPVIAAALVALPLVLAAAVAAPRLVEIARFTDPSLRVRLVYAEGALRGATQRPALGWGPGASRWTLGRFLAAGPGWRPPGEVVTDPHSLPLELAYDLGASGLLLAAALVGLFVWRRVRELRVGSADGQDRGAALLGLAGLGLVSLVGRPLSAAALPLTAVVLAGASLPSPSSRTARRAWPAWLYGLLALALLVRPALATFAYQRALQSSARSAALLERATSLDPALPLYRLHRALGLAARQPGSTLAAREAVAASRAAVGLAPLWLAAGLLARDAGEASAAGALLEACALDPLGALAPFALMAETADAELAAARGGRAILADPVLAAAVHWDEHPLQFAEAVSRVATWPGLSADWQSELVARLERLERRRRRGEAAAAERVVWSLEVDGRPATALALHAFRRTPWPFELGAVELDARVAATLAAVPAAGALPATDPAAFPERLCAGPPDLSGRP